MQVRWLALTGNIEFGANSVTFLGVPQTPPGAASAANTEESSASDVDQPPPSPMPSIGSALASMPAGDGTVYAEITFEEVTALTACDFIVSYDPETRAQLNVGLGGVGSFAMVGVREWVPQTTTAQARWHYHASVGDRSNMKPGVRYELEVRLTGSRAVVLLNGVEALIASGLPERKGQIGLFFVSSGKVTVENIRISAVPARAFVVMQFTSPFNEIYADVIRDACHSFGLEPVRADDTYGPGLIITDIIEQIQSARVVIADVTAAPGVNANVYWEVGFAHGVGRPLILLAESSTKLPFDISGFRTLFYENSITGRGKFDAALKRHLGAVLGKAASAPPPPAAGI
jgi:hypothetical protein